MRQYMPGMIYQVEDPAVDGMARAYFRMKLRESGYHPQMIQELLAMEIASSSSPADLMQHADEYPGPRIETGIERVAREQWLQENING